MSQKRVAILGCGPAGLLVAQAALLSGIDMKNIHIFSKKTPSTMYGAQYLHRNIPGLNLPDPVQVTSTLWGTIDQYRLKIYGKGGYEGPVSAEEFGDKTVDAWDIRLAYKTLWDIFEDQIIHIDLTAKLFAEAYPLLGPSYGNDFIFNTIPKITLCKNSPVHDNKKACTFDFASIWASGDAPDQGIFCPIPREDNTIVLNGNKDGAWYRSACVFGHATAEWPTTGKKPPVENLASVRKPISNSCDCYPDIHHAGRYGEWKKGVLIHHAFEKAEQVLQG